LFLVGVLAGLASSCVIAVVDDGTGGAACGENAVYDLDYRECFCPDGFDGDPYDRCDPLMTFLVTDACDDGEDIDWKLWSTDYDWSWPQGSSVYVTEGLNVDVYQDIVCELGETICFGALAQDGSTRWGVGLEGPDVRECADCCVACDAIEFDLGYLTCE
jgi:hypothetical protein